MITAIIVKATMADAMYSHTQPLSVKYQREFTTSLNGAVITKNNAISQIYAATMLIPSDISHHIVGSAMFIFWLGVKHNICIYF